MQIPEELLATLVCPQSRGKLEQVGDRLECKESNLSYPIVDGIPVLIVEEARPIE